MNDTDLGSESLQMIPPLGDLDFRGLPHRPFPGKRALLSTRPVKTQRPI